MFGHWSIIVHTDGKWFFNWQNMKRMGERQCSSCVKKGLVKHFYHFGCVQFHKKHCAEKRFPVTSNLRYMHGVLNIDEIKN
jgi:hypothetical protein